MTDMDLITQLIKALSGEPQESANARAKLLQMGKAVVEPLVETMMRANGKESLAAARLLGELMEPQALEPLFKALALPSPLLAWEVLRAILKYPGRDTLVRLVETMPHCHLITQQNIVLAMQDQNDPRVVPALIKQLSVVESPTLLYAIIQTLGMLGDSQAIPAIHAHRNDSNHHVREWVAVALRQLSADGT